MKLRHLPLLLLAAFPGCGDDGEPDPLPEDIGFFWQPRSFCLPVADTGDTLFVTNFDDAPLQWQPERVPAGSTNLNLDVTIQPGTTVGIVWTWIPGGTGVVTDTLVVETNDPSAPRVVIPFRREAAGYLDDDAPPAPVLGLPEDGATFAVGDTIEVMWTRVSDCSGIARYEFRVALTPQFSGADQVFFADTPHTGVGIEVEEDDRGKQAFWRVRARDNAGYPSPWSEIRSWTID